MTGDGVRSVRAVDVEPDLDLALGELPIRDRKAEPAIVALHE
jgi:hypothetical protein